MAKRESAALRRLQELKGIRREREEKKKTFRLPIELAKQLEHARVELGIPEQEIVRRALIDFFNTYMQASKYASIDRNEG